MKVLLLGATGLIGHSCLEYLLAAPNVSQVIAPTRRTLPNRDPKLRNVLVDFDRLDEYPELFDVSTILCCLGTTMKQAGSRENFRKVDYQYCRDAAELGRAHRARAFLLVSAIGANANSPVYYSRVKGELEAKLRSLEYEYLSIYRPSMLLGQRDEVRLGETLYARLTPVVDLFMRGPLKPYHAIKGSTVARAMVNEALQLGETVPAGPKVRIHDYENIVKLAQSQ